MSMLPAVSASSAIPTEIIEAILCLLPAKSLGRFKSVSKTWNSLISHPHFIKKHLNHHQTTKLILLSITKALYSLDTNQLLPYLLNINRSFGDDDIPATANEVSCGWLKFLGSCNGLVLAKEEDGTIILINPTTQERWEVPPFAFLNGHGSVKYGFGYDSSTDDYKVVAMRDATFVPTCAFVSVYSLRKNSWKKLPNFKHFGFRLQRSFPVVVNENVYWYRSPSTIVSFSCTTEEVNELSLQFLVPSVGRKAWIRDLVDIGGKLGVLFSRGRVYELWVMEGDGTVGSCLTLVCCLMLKEHIKLVSLVEGSNRDIILDDVGDVVVYNIDGERCRPVRIGEDFDGFDVLGTYAESLESPTRILTAPPIID